MFTVIAEMTASESDPPPLGLTWGGYVDTRLFPITLALFVIALANLTGQIEMSATAYSLNCGFAVLSGLHAISCVLYAIYFLGAIAYAAHRGML